MLDERIVLAAVISLPLVEPVYTPFRQTVAVR